ncbi:MAG: ABC transporter substrate-binding protein [Phycisphaerales bacterium]|nr:ABC transporter substrate-binding protein [Phycisphaerales bacterium]
MQRTSRLVACLGAIALAAVLVACKKPTSPDAHGTPAPASPKSPLKVGFSQIGAESDWRKANSESIRSEAAARGVNLVFSDAQQKQENQIKALRTFIVQDVDVIVFAPVVKTGWEPVLREIRDAGIPVILTDRRVENEDLYTTFIGADFVEEGRRAARFLADATSGNAVIAELEGTPGADPAIDRKKGFAEVLAQHPGMKIIKSQSGEFTRAKGREVMETFLKSPEGPSITALYAHNDDMALGAIQAIEEAGRRPGEDIIIVSVDGVRAAFEAMVEGKLNCTVECNPLLGPILFDTIEKIVAGQQVPKWIATEEGVFTRQTAAEDIKTRKY